MDMTGQWFLWALLSAFFAALTALFAKAGVQGVHPDLAAFIRTAVVVMVLGAFAWKSGAWTDPRLIPPRTWSFLLLSALATGASWICYFRALQSGDASAVSAVDRSSLALVALLAVLFLGERPSPRDWLGIALVTAGAALMAFKR